MLPGAPSVTVADTQQSGAALRPLLECQAITDNALRLACYDQAVVVLDRARLSGEVTVVNRDEVRNARSQLFGFNVGSLAIFGRDGDAPVQAVDTTLASAVQTGRGEWVFSLANGSVWRQTDATRLPSPPRPGQAIRIREAAMGSYLLSVGNNRAVRARRDR